MRSDVGALVSMEVRVSNVRSTDVDSALLSIFYPASAPETGNYFYLLPDCGVATLISVCDDSASGLCIKFYECVCATGAYCYISAMHCW